MVITFSIYLPFFAPTISLKFNIITTNLTWDCPEKIGPRHLGSMWSLQTEVATYVAVVPFNAGSARPAGPGAMGAIVGHGN